MNTFSAFLKLIRFPNLIIISLTQYMMRYCIIYPMVKINDFELQLSSIDFFYLVLCTVLIAAAGYIINDYFDVRIDDINKPDKVVVGKYIKRRWAMTWHLVFNIVAFILSFSLAYRIGNYKLSLIFVVASGLLWYYSTTFKKQFLVGNIITALLTGFVPLLVGLFELPLLNYKYADVLQQYEISFNNIAYFLIGFSVFAFITTLIREIAKDLEDLEGDQKYGGDTLAIRLGTKKTNRVVVFLIIITMLGLGYLQYIQLGAKDYKSFFYFLVLLQFPYLYMIRKVAKAEQKADYTFISKLNKVIILFGVLFSVVIYYSILYTEPTPPPAVEEPTLNISGGY